MLLPVNTDCCCCAQLNKVQTTTNANSCPLRFVYSNNSDGKECSHCQCKENFGDVVVCDEKLQKSYLQLDHCMTYNSSYDGQDSDAISFGAYPYAYSSNIIRERGSVLYLGMAKEISKYHTDAPAGKRPKKLLPPKPSMQTE